jgi:hypothetical protein
MNRTAIIADRAVFEGLVKVIDVAYTTLIARRVRLFDSEATAVTWLNKGRVGRAGGKEIKNDR